MQEYLITQSIYRDLLEVMSRPGSVRQLTVKAAEISPNGMVALAATLLDQEVTYSVLNDDGLNSAVRKKTDARPAALSEADFVFIAGGSSDGKISGAQRGTLRYPDSGATIIYLVEQLAEQSSESNIDLTGPGIAEVSKPFIGGLDMSDLEMLGIINQEYPLGIDIILIDRKSRVMALPRSIKITISES